MDSTASHKWLAELENEEVGELDFIDALTMQQLAESLAHEFWEQQPIHHQEQQQVEELLLDQQQQLTNTNTTGFPFHGDMVSRRSYAEDDDGLLPTAAISAGGNNESVFSFTTGGKSEQLMSFSTSREPKQEESNGGGQTTTAAGRTPLTAIEGSSKGGRRASSGVVHEHVVAERKRREKMNRQFAALASIIPDITKTDKVSLLGSTIEHVHHLRGRLKALQEERRQSSTGSTAESPPLDARCCVDGSLDDDELDGGGSVTTVSCPKIEADVRGTTVLLRVVCREKKGVLIMLLKELEKHGLSTINTNVLLLASSSLNITITAQIEDGFSTAIELVNNLNAALNNF